ncbi:F-box/LRR-repeat protein 7-like isoform X2 [Anneissia japonica]|uniref:F-box/LRR-repeat protein 7-like isoform X2 n=1 Tax=Anneissia japonica TaxID=1529436 RepID=UPI001425A13F|nr:F-box/LRR-repeat protein 7-like isoform X2 [Anneissia japonica]
MFRSGQCEWPSSCACSYTKPVSNMLSVETKEESFQMNKYKDGPKKTVRIMTNGYITPTGRYQGDSSYGSASPTYSSPASSTQRVSPTIDLDPDRGTPTSQTSIDQKNSKSDSLRPPSRTSGEITVQKSALKKRTLTKNLKPLFDLLPDDLIIRILSYLPSRQLCRTAGVSRRFYKLSWQPVLWTNIRISGERTDIDRAMKVLTRRLCQETPYVCLSVQKLVLSGCERLGEKGLTLIAQRYPELQHLELSGCTNLTNEALFEIVSKCLQLDYLDISGCPHITCFNLSSEAASESCQLQGQSLRLRHLDMSNCAALDDKGLRTVGLNCPGLQNLYLRRCQRITDEGLKEIANCCSVLKEISVIECRRITDYGMRALSKIGASLRHVSIAKCDQITDLGVHSIAKYCSKLRYLNVRGCAFLTDKAMVDLARGCVRLRSLDIGKCSQVTDQGVTALAIGCMYLRKLSLKGCVLVKDEGIHMMAQYCPELQQLNIQECQVSVEAFKTFKKTCRKCIIEHTNPAFY